MAPVSTLVGSKELLDMHVLSSRDYGDGDSNSYNFKSTPAVAVIVPVVVLILILLSAAAYSCYTFWRKRLDRDRLIKASTPKSRRKLLPSWISNWFGPLQSKSAPRSGFGANANGKINANVDPNTSVDSLPAKTKGMDIDDVGDADSDVIALRTVEVPFPQRSFPIREHEPGRPKAMGTPVAFGGL